MMYYTFVINKKIKILSSIHKYIYFVCIAFPEPEVLLDSNLDTIIIIIKQ